MPEVSASEMVESSLDRGIIGEGGCRRASASHSLMKAKRSIGIDLLVGLGGENDASGDTDLDSTPRDLKFGIWLLEGWIEITGGSEISSGREYEREFFLSPVIERRTDPKVRNGLLGILG
jgi:hypothetical protein